MMAAINWEMLAAIGQLATVLVGIPSLIYLAVQIREQTKDRHQAAVNVLTVQWSDLTKSLHDDPELGRIFLTGLQSFKDLDAVSKLRFSAFFNRFLKNFQAMYFAHKQGLLSEELWGEIDRTMSDFIAYPGWQQWWLTRKHWHTEEFAGVIETIIARGASPQAYSGYDISKVHM